MAKLEKCEAFVTEIARILSEQRRLEEHQRQTQLPSAIEFSRADAYEKIERLSRRSEYVGLIVARQTNDRGAAGTAGR